MCCYTAASQRVALLTLGALLVSLSFAVYMISLYFLYWFIIWLFGNDTKVL